MNPSVMNKRTPLRLMSRASRFAHHYSRVLAAFIGGLPLTFTVIGSAVAQTAASPAGSIGAQLNSMSAEAINSGSTAFGMACYLAAAICFGFGVWSLWQSRHPQNRESGHVAKGLAGLVLCGLFAEGGAWINKAAVSTTGGNATINDTPSMVQFGASNGGG